MHVFINITTSFVRVVVLVLLSPLITFTTAQAATIEYVASDLADITSGEDLWRCDYAVNGSSFLQEEFFDIYFAPTLHRTLTVGPAPIADWDVAILQRA